MTQHNNSEQLDLTRLEFESDTIVVQCSDARNRSAWQLLVVRCLLSILRTGSLSHSFGEGPIFAYPEESVGFHDEGR